MTADRRLQIGGWAALLVAVLGPAHVVALFATSNEPEPFVSRPALLIEVARLAAALVAVIGLDRLYRPLAPDLARFAFRAGVSGAAVVIALDVALLAGLDVSLEGWLLVVAVVANILIGAWLILGGAALMRQGGGLMRVGWTSQLGGLGMILTVLSLSTGLGGRVGTGVSWIDWFLILGLFTTIFLIRVWSYVVRGRLPGPGIL